MLIAVLRITQKMEEENSGFLSEFGCLFKENDYKFIKRMIVSYFPPHALGKMNAFEVKLVCLGKFNEYFATALWHNFTIPSG